MSKSVYVKHAYERVYDAFWDQGWLNWTRFLFKKGEVIYIKGKTIDADETKILKQTVIDLTTTGAM